MSKLATPTPAIDSDMSHVIDDGTSALKDATNLVDKTMPLGELLDAHLARVRTIDYAEEDDISESMKLLKLKTLKHLLDPVVLDMNFLLCLRFMLWMER